MAIMSAFVITIPRTNPGHASCPKKSLSWLRPTMPHPHRATSLPPKRKSAIIVMNSLQNDYDPSRDNLQPTGPDDHIDIEATDVAGDDDNISPEDDQSATAWKNAVVAMMDDYIKTGRNICIGDGPTDLLLPFLDTLDIHLQTSPVMDLAFVATTPANNRLLRNRELPSDLSLNYSNTIDVYVAPATQVDSDLNVVLHADDDPASDGAAAHLAKRAVFLVREEAVIEGKQHGIRSIPIKISPFLPAAAVQHALLSPVLRSLGVHDVTRRRDSTCSDILDVHLISGAAPALVRDELMRLPVVQSVALHPASPSTAFVVAPLRGPPYDMTSRQRGMRMLSRKDRTTAAKEETVAAALDKLPGWRLVTGVVPALATQMRFKDVACADVFVRYVQNLSNVTKHHPEIRQTLSNVRICLTTFEAKGVTQLDILFARDLAQMYKRLS